VINSILTFLYLASMLVCSIMAIIYRESLRTRHLTILVWFLPVVFIQESTLAYFATGTISTAPVYNFYKPISLLVIAFIYYQVPFLEKARGYIIGISLVFISFTITNYIFLESITTTSSYLTIIRGLVITSFAVIFLYYYFNIDNLATEKYWLPLVWITIGIVTFYPVTSISTGFHNLLYVYKGTFLGVKLYQVIPKIMSIFMYGCFSYAFYLCKKKN